jgi:predicted Fe-Mo cluster-binding NifX family protein
MKAAIPIFGNRVAPRFDCAQAFLLVTTNEGPEPDRVEVGAADWAPHDRINKLLELGVDTVLCGGIDWWSLQSLQSTGIVVYDGVVGELESALAALLRGDIESARASGALPDAPSPAHSDGVGTSVPPQGRVREAGAGRGYGRRRRRGGRSRGGQGR